MVDVAIGLCGHPVENMVVVRQYVGPDDRLVVEVRSAPCPWRPVKAPRRPAKP